MREIKFRGKRLDNGEWVYGNICENLDRSICIQTVIEKVVDGMAVPNLCFPIDIATVGQYTGLRDKNGEEVYEGDILLDESGFYAVVGYSMGAFYVDFGEGFDLQYFNEGIHEICDVAGNIHDHQHLLK